MNPLTEREWRGAAVMAYSLLLIQQRRDEEGLDDTFMAGEGINVTRCIEILEEAERRGFAKVTEAEIREFFGDGPDGMLFAGRRDMHLRRLIGRVPV